MMVEADRLELDLPYVRFDSYSKRDGQRHVETFTDPVTDRKITIHSMVIEKANKPSKQMVMDLNDSLLQSTIKGKGRIFLHEELGFPLLVDIQGVGERLLEEPKWLNEPYETKDLSPLLGRAGKEPYTACTLLILRPPSDAGDAGKEVLLSQRKWGSGAGTYAAPGGKKEKGETLRDCVIRELREETGLVFLEGRPVSLTNTRRRGYPPVRSVGILVTKWAGKPRHIDRAHKKWDWHPLSDLPSPLFFPTQKVIQDLRANPFPNLKWDDKWDDNDPISSLPLWKGI
jgi:8-oxo-dGTP diphosphatase